VSDVDIKASIAFHRERGKLVTVTAVQPPGRFGALSFTENGLTRFVESRRAMAWVNGGFSWLRREPSTMSPATTPAGDQPHGKARAGPTRRVSASRIQRRGHDAGQGVPRAVEQRAGALEYLGSSGGSQTVSAAGNCRHCGAELDVTFCDLGLSPLANSYLSREQLNQGEMFFPLHTFVCGSCFLVQLQEFETAANIFSDYAYFSSYSESWLDHARVYTEQMIARFGLDSTSSVIELRATTTTSCNTLPEGHPGAGVEPAANVAKSRNSVNSYTGSVLRHRAAPPW
jgi:hypothetical protein